MDYYDPFLNQWLTGASGQTVAPGVRGGCLALNNELGQLYSANKAAMADPATLFQTTNFALTGTYNGTTVPENVALVSTWTLMCSENNIHANDQGHAELALAFESVIDQPPTTSVLIPSGGATVSGIALFDAAASDAGFVGKVQFALTGGSLNQTVVGTATPTLYGYLFDLNTTTLPNGSYTVQSIASDTAGNSGSRYRRPDHRRQSPSDHVGGDSFCGGHDGERHRCFGCECRRCRRGRQGPVCPQRRDAEPDGGGHRDADPLRLSPGSEHHDAAQWSLHTAERGHGFGSATTGYSPGVRDQIATEPRRASAGGRRRAVRPRNVPCRCAAAQSTGDDEPDVGVGQGVLAVAVAGHHGPDLGDADRDRP